MYINSYLEQQQNPLVSRAKYLREFILRDLNYADGESLLIWLWCRISPSVKLVNLSQTQIVLELI